MSAKLDTQGEEYTKEMKLDYEQLEAEREMFGVKGEMMDFALHPQMAEMAEEFAAGKQTFTDKCLWEWEYAKHMKRERLMQLQDETQRAMFLERHKMALKIHGQT